MRCEAIHTDVKTLEFVRCNKDAVEGERRCAKDIAIHNLYAADQERRDAIFRELLGCTDKDKRDALYRRLETGK